MLGNALHTKVQVCTDLKQVESDPHGGADITATFLKHIMSSI